MVQANVLRIGNKVQDKNGFILEVVSVFKDDTIYCDFEGNEGDVWEFDKNNPCHGIELTEEILLKCGFEFDTINLHGNLIMPLSVKCRDGYFDYLYIKKHKEAVGLRSIRDIEIKYLHQLQNLYFALTGKELNIQL